MGPEMNLQIDLLALGDLLWPHYTTCKECNALGAPNPRRFPYSPCCAYHQNFPGVTFYNKQKEIISSIEENDETIVPAGNMLGKDFTAGFLALSFFLTRSPCRVLTTSVDGEQLEGVLWGEIRRFIQISKYPLESENGGPLLINHLHIRRIDPKTKRVDPLSYLLGRVAKKGEGMLGHHVPRTGDGIPRSLFIGDEASGLDDLSIERAKTWCERLLLIGNCYDCRNYFFRAIKGGGGLPGGDILATHKDYIAK